MRHRRRVGAQAVRERLLEPHDHVEQEIAEARRAASLYDPPMDEERRRDRLRSFLIGGVVGASAAIAAPRACGAHASQRETPAGLAAFEDAPCYRELIERERGV